MMMPANFTAVNSEVVYGGRDRGYGLRLALLIAEDALLQAPELIILAPVSYTHLTLPTKRIV